MLYFCLMVNTNKVADLLRGKPRFQKRSLGLVRSQSQHVAGLGTDPRLGSMHSSWKQCDRPTEDSRVGSTGPIRASW